MAVFPESMKKLNVEDTSRSLTAIENYIAYMTERIEFSMRNLTRVINEAGVSPLELLVLIQAQAQVLADVQSSLALTQAAVTELQHDVRDITDRLGTFAETDPTIKATLTDFEQRISALENRT